MYFYHSKIKSERGGNVMRDLYIKRNELCKKSCDMRTAKWDLDIKPEHLRFRDHDKAALAFYSVATTDIEYLFPFGWGELWGIADRTDYDLKKHMERSGEDMIYFDPVTNEKYIPYNV